MSKTHVMKSVELTLDINVKNPSTTVHASILQLQAEIERRLVEIDRQANELPAAGNTEFDARLEYRPDSYSTYTNVPF